MALSNVTLEELLFELDYAGSSVPWTPIRAGSRASARRAVPLCRRHQFHGAGFPDLGREES